MTLKEAYKLFVEKYPEYCVESILETYEEWIFSVNDKETGLELDIPPYAVNKKTGTICVFFPPTNRKKIKEAKVINISELET